uniref:Fibronectin type-III domain-containing protein n=1 Tax=Anabas testudineus TaxID=64144 RepID=A0AAQ6IK65_ANATE
MMMIMWLLLVALFCKSTQDGNGHAALPCGPRNLTLSSSDQMILLTWEDDPSCFTVHDTLVYELLVLIADNQEHYEEVTVAPDQIGSTHLWNWTSHLALECASHTVRLSSRYKNQTSPWKLEQTLPAVAGQNNLEVAVYPQDRVFQVGSTVTFCCIVPTGATFSRLYLGRYNNANMNTTKISNQTYALTVYLDQPSKNSCNNVKCETNRGGSGACAYIDYPPGDKGLQCETRTLTMAECQWTVGNNARLAKTRNVYWLHGGYKKSECKDGAKGRCSIEIPVNVTEVNWTLTVENPLGKVELTDKADMTRRVHMLAPDNPTVSNVNARNVSLHWEWSKAHYQSLGITCQVNVSYGGTHTTSENSGVGLNYIILKDLIPNWKYYAAVRCATTEHFWKWGDWSRSVSFHTKGDVPDALDVWMLMKDNKVVVAWKMPLAHQSHGNIENYTVTWAKTTETEQQENTTVPHSEHQVELSLNTKDEYIVAVTATNINGSSYPSTITIPRRNSDPTRVPSRINGSNGSFYLSWSASSNASCGYIVDWYPTLGGYSVEWLKVPPNETNCRIFSENFKDGLRYTLSIYACTQGAPVLLERREGYVKEKGIKKGLFEPLKWKQQDSDVEVSWATVSLTNQTAFIQGYILYWSDNNNNSRIFNVSTADPGATSLTAKNLKIGTYTFTVKALTALGECGTTQLSATLNSLTDNLIKVVIISLASASGLLFLLTFICCRYWTCIKRKVYPPIPKPVLIDKWLTSPVGSDNHENQFLLLSRSSCIMLCVALEEGPPLVSRLNISTAAAWIFIICTDTCSQTQESDNRS